MSIFKRINRKAFKIFHPIEGEILMFHRVLTERSPIEDKINYDLEITPDYLEQIILKYKREGFRFASINEVYDQMKRKKHISQPFACFTFDDGFVDNYLLAYPIFKKYNCPFTIYVTSGFVDEKEKIWWCNENKAGKKKLALTIEQLKMLANDPLCTIGSHTVSHPKLENLTEEKQFFEMQESKKRLEEIIGCEVIHFSYPHGSYNEKSPLIAQKCGYKTAVRNYGDIVRQGDNLYLLNRRYIFQN
jgi:peptidoglycan/xylan/chitin deacetylase (PgdA/CDA1 family)